MALGSGAIALAGLAWPLLHRLLVRVHREAIEVSLA